MQNKEIFTYEIPNYLINEPSSKHLSTAESASIDLTLNFSLMEKLYRDIWIIKKIGKYNLSRYLILSVSYEEDLFFVENREFNIWGDGETLNQAFKSFEDFFLYDLMSYLKTSPKDMDYFACQELRRYKDILNIS